MFIILFQSTLNLVNSAMTVVCFNVWYWEMKIWEKYGIDTVMTTLTTVVIVGVAVIVLSGCPVLQD